MTNSVDAQFASEQRRGAILVDDRFDALKYPVRADHGNAAAAARNHQHAAFTSSRITPSSTISMGSGEGTTRRYPRAASSTISHPNWRLRSSASRAGIERADGLGGMPHGGIVCRDDRLRDHAHHRHLQTCSASSASSACASK